MSADDPKPPRDDDRDPAEDEQLLDVAGEILDGEDVEWDAASPYLEELKAIGEVARLSREPNAAGDDLPPTVPEPAAAPLGRWGSLDLLARVAEGAYGEVYRAWDPRLDREVALKLLRAATAPRHRQTTVIAEGRLLARIRHPNVVTVFGAEEIDGRVGIWTEFVHGETLAERVRGRGRFPAGEAIAIGVTLCQALTAIHDAGVVHGDVKAQNVLQEPGGRIVLVDLGTGHEEVLDVAAAPKRRLSGTPLYMAPELWTLQPPTPRSDVYSLGVLLYFLVTGAYPVRGETPEDVREAHRTRRRVPLGDAAPDLPRTFVAAVDRALAHEPADRFASASEFRDALDVADPVKARRRRRRLQARIAAGASVIALVAAAAWVIGTWATPPDRRPGPREEQITFEPPERGVLAAAISPDGSRLAYSHADGLSIQRVATREVEPLSLPPGFSDIIDLAWLPQNSALIAATEDALWRVDAIGTAAPVRVAPFGGLIAISPDGRQLAVRQLGRGIVIVSLDGTAPERLLAPVAPQVGLSRPTWSPDGRRIAYGKYVNVPSQASRAIASRPSTGGPEAIAIEVSTLFQVAWAHPGRILFSSSQPRPTARYHDLFAIDVDPQTGAARSPVIEVLAGRLLRLHTPSITRDGEVLAFVSNPLESQVYVAEFDPDRLAMEAPVRRTFTSTFDQPTSWGPTGNEIVFRAAGRTGFVMYRQPFGRQTPRLLLPPGVEVTDAVLTTDGQATLYLTQASMMRAPIDGRPPDALFERPVNATVRCARASTRICVAVGRPAGPLRMIVSFDPDRGEPHHHVRLALDWWDLAPDGEYLVGLDQTPARELVVLHLASDRVTRIPIVGLENVQYVAWAGGARGGWIVTRQHGRSGTEVLHIDRQGRPTSIWQDPKLRLTMPVVSPDGRRLAFSRSFNDSNVWLLRGF